MKRAGALLVLMLVVLWTAAPAFACFGSAHGHACCHPQMQSCDGAAMSAGGSCCAVRPMDANAPRSWASTAEKPGHAAPLETITLPALASVTTAVPGRSMAILFPDPPPGGTVLRI